MEIAYCQMDILFHPLLDLPYNLKNNSEVKSMDWIWKNHKGSEKNFQLELTPVISMI
ncbi:MAG: hypothetical protein ACTHKC_10630 [Candidatus Nitrosocosmicus sp.]